MILNIRMSRPGYPFLQEKTVKVNVNIEEDPEIQRLNNQGFHIVSAEVNL